MKILEDVFESILENVIEQLAALRNNKLCRLRVGDLRPKTPFAHAVSRLKSQNIWYADLQRQVGLEAS